MSLFSKKKLNELQAKESSTKLHTVLIVDDEESNRKVMASVLKDYYDVLESEDALAALELVENMENPEKISMVISDQRMPNMTGVELFERLAEIIPKTIRIIVTGFIDVESIIDSVNKAHIYKFILKPFERVDFLWTAKRAVENFELQKELDNHLLSLEQRVVDRAKALTEKTQELAQAQQTIESLTVIDPLTDLYNLRFLSLHLDADIAQCQRIYQDFNNRKLDQLPPDIDLVFLLIDIDQFKDISKNLSQAAADAVLKGMKGLLQKVFRVSDYLIHYHNETFLVVVRSTTIDDAAMMAERLRSLMSNYHFTVADGISVNKTCSIGFVGFPFIGDVPDTHSWEEVVEVAKHALATVKRNGQNGWMGITVPLQVEASLELQQVIDNTEALVNERKLLIYSNIKEDINW